jgi:hypothetical protein
LSVPPAEAADPAAEPVPSDGSSPHAAGEPVTQPVQAAEPAHLEHPDNLPVEPTKALGNTVDWSQRIEPNKPVTGEIDWSQGVSPGGTEMATHTADVLDRPQWLAESEGYHERFLAPAAGGAPAAIRPGPGPAPWQEVGGPQKSRIIPIVGAGALAIALLIWVASSAGVSPPTVELPFFSRGDSGSAATQPKPAPRPPAVVGRNAHAGERYDHVMSVDGARMETALSALTAACPPGSSADDCRASSQNALDAVRNYRRDLALIPVTTCLRAVNTELQAGLALYDEGLAGMVRADNLRPADLRAAQAVFDSGTQHMVAVKRLLDNTDISACH